MANQVLDRQIEDLGREFGVDAVADAFLAFAARSHTDCTDLLTRLAAGLPLRDSQLLDAAAAIAARHDALAGEEEGVRRLLAVFSLQDEITDRIAGEPRHVIDDHEQFLTEQARMWGEAKRTIWREPMLSPGSAAAALGAKATNREKVRQLRLRSHLLGLPSGRGYFYPTFQFDEERQAIFPEVSKVNEMLDAAGDPWGVASWWLGGHARLSGTRPSDLVGTDRTPDVIAVAQAALEPLG